MSKSGEGTRKVGLSCAECRRSKLKCDRNFPCQSCVRRGCPGICPEGTLAATKGNKVLMAHAQKLTDQVKVLTTRVQELEAALAETSDGKQSHPLLQIRLPIDGEEQVEVEDIPGISGAIGSLSLGLDGQTIYHGECSSSTHLQNLLPTTQPATNSLHPQDLDLPLEITNLMTAFPFGVRGCSYTTTLFSAYIPSRERALSITALYYTQVAWISNPIIYSDFVATVLDPLYGSAGYVTVQGISSQRLALFFIILANGVLFDSHPASVAMANQYHALSRAALSLQSLLEETSCTTVQVLFLIYRFIHNYDRSGNEERWLIIGLCVRVAQSIGLQRDSAPWQLDPAEIQRRRRTFWEVFIGEAWASILNGRPPIMLLEHTDCLIPDDLEFTANSSGDVQQAWEVWKLRYAASCVTATIKHVFQTKTPSYSALLALDKRIRQFPTPDHLRSPVRACEPGRAWSSDPGRALQQYCALSLRESNLLYIHRSYFVVAIRGNSDNPLRHRYAASVLATYRSACRLISSLRGLNQVHPEATSKVWHFWSNVYSSCVVLAALVIESPNCTLAQDAIQELEVSVPFYEQGSRLRREPASVSILQSLLDRAASSYTAYRSGIKVEPRSQRDLSYPDKLEVLGGRKSVVRLKSNSGSPDSFNSPPGLVYSESSSNGAEEMLTSYYRPIEPPSFESPSHHEEYETVTDHCARELPFPAMPRPREPQLQTPLFNGSYVRSLAPLDRREYAPDQVHLQGQSDYKQRWNNGPLSYQEQNYNLPPITDRGNEMPFNILPPLQSHPLPSSYQMAPGEPHQEDIWKNFMREYSRGATSN